ncbi:hypothetical protein ACFYMO_30925 [Streptomyces sp. NPDC007025]|uniref:hypothetical protein n=1 Tax=Streptomyces sp. NPDC007025 TaxID=3364771 RepID=UPI00367C7D12
MIPAPYRMKGAAPVLGARTAGETGPFGPYGGKTETTSTSRIKVNRATASYRLASTRARAEESAKAG